MSPIEPRSSSWALEAVSATGRRAAEAEQDTASPSPKGAEAPRRSEEGGRPSLPERPVVRKLVPRGSQGAAAAYAHWSGQSPVSLFQIFLGPMR